MGSKRRNNAIDGQFSARTIEMLESPAYRVLSLSAHRVLDRICIELAHHGGNDNGKLPVTYEQFVAYGIHRHAIAPAIRELEALGFLVVTQHGRPSAGEFRLPNLFLIPWINSKSSPNPTKSWQRFADLEAAEKAACAARHCKKQKSSDGNRHCATDGNRHCHGQSPVSEIITTVPVLETITTSISRDEVSVGKAREARAPQSAEASEPVPNGNRSDLVQASIARRLGRDGWLILQCISPGSLDNMVALERSGKLDERALEAARLEYRRSAA